MALRWTVFVEEQGVPVADELDGQDDACMHVIARDQDVVLGAARYKVTDGAVKIQRVCVPASARGSGIGTALITWICAHSEARVAVLSAQVDALGFYETLGFSGVGVEYLDAGILHRDMQRKL